MGIYRWLVHGQTRPWGVLSTTSVHLNGSGYGNVFDHSDGTGNTHFVIRRGSKQCKCFPNWVSCSEIVIYIGSFASRCVLGANPAKAVLKDVLPSLQLLLNLPCSLPLATTYYSYRTIITTACLSRPHVLLWSDLDELWNH